MHLRLSPVALLAALATLPLAAHAENWSNWRGPAYNGSSPETDLPQTWSATEGIKWKTPLPGASGATPAVWGDSVFVSSTDPAKNLLLLCLDRKDGKVRWQKQIVEAGDVERGRNNMASPSPVTDGKAVYILNRTGDLAAFDFDGKVLWQRNLGKDYGKFSINWIYGSSPLLYAGRLYIQVLQRSPAPPDYPGIGSTTGDRESYLLALRTGDGPDALEARAADGCESRIHGILRHSHAVCGAQRQGADPHRGRRLPERPRSRHGRRALAGLRAQPEAWRSDAPRAQSRQCGRARHRLRPS